MHSSESNCRNSNKIPILDTSILHNRAHTKKGDQVVPLLEQKHHISRRNPGAPQAQFLSPIPIYKNVYVLIISCREMWWLLIP